MKQLILDFLKSDRSFDKGVQLYMKHGPSESFKRILNRQGFSEYNRNLLLEELRKLGGIPEDQFRYILSCPVEKPVAAKVAEDLPPTPAEATAFVSQLPDYVKKSIRLRDEFPFLKEKHCPEPLKILVSDMISAYDRYHEAHERLFTALTPEDFAAASADVVENYLENREIWDELNHYKEKGEILGKHPIFERLIRFAEIAKLSGTELVKLQKSLENNIARNKKKIADEPDHPETNARKQRVDDYTAELSEVKHLLSLK